MERRRGPYARDVETEPSAAELERLLAAPAERFGIDLPGVSGRLARYAALLLRWNERINLTGAETLDQLAREHLGDAFAIAPQLPRAGRCIDVGSGAGLPGIVLAVLRPDLHFTLLEPRQKRRAFLLRVQRELGLTNVAVLAIRVEEHLLDAEQDYDLAVARATLPLAEWLQIGRRLVRPGGAVIGLAGADPGSLSVECQRFCYDSGAGPRTILRVQV